MLGTLVLFLGWSLLISFLTALVVRRNARRYRKYILKPHEARLSVIVSKQLHLYIKKSALNECISMKKWVNRELSICVLKKIKIQKMAQDSFFKATPLKIISLAKE